MKRPPKVKHCFRNVIFPGLLILSFYGLEPENLVVTSPTSSFQPVSTLIVPYSTMSQPVNKLDICNNSEKFPVYFREGNQYERLPKEYVCCNIPGLGMDTELFETIIAGCTCGGESCGASCGPGCICGGDSCNASCVPGCTCGGDSRDKSREAVCTCQKYGWNYLDFGIIHDAALSRGSTSVIQECNSNCSCSNKCVNRVVQNGIQVKLEVISNDEKGLGLRTLESIKRGQFVCEYAGEVLTEMESRKRLGALVNTDDMNYLFILQEHVASGVLYTYIDPKYRGNIGRFINHSCEPNLSVVPVRVFNMVPRVCLFAARDILAGEEMTYDYGQNDPIVHDSAETNLTNMKVCKCQAKRCKGYLPFNTIVI